MDTLQIMQQVQALNIYKEVARINFSKEREIGKIKERNYSIKNNFIIPDYSYKLKPFRRERIQIVNALVREGFSIQDIADNVEFSDGKDEDGNIYYRYYSASTIRTWYFGYAFNCLHSLCNNYFGPRFAINITKSEKLQEYGIERCFQFKTDEYQILLNDNHPKIDQFAIPLFLIDLYKYDSKEEMQQLMETFLPKDTFEIIEFTRRYYVNRNIPYIVMYKGACCDI